MSKTCYFHISNIQGYYNLGCYYVILVVVVAQNEFCYEIHSTSMK